MSAPVDHPGLCAACAARMEQARLSGKAGIAVCGECSARQASLEAAEAAKPRTLPTPWRWTGVDDFVVRNGRRAGERAWTAIDLVDAEGRPVAMVTNSDVMDFAAAGVRELLAAAPDLELALRFALDVIREAVDDGWRPTTPDAGFGCAKARALLAGIDRAKAGG